SRSGCKRWPTQRNFRCTFAMFQREERSVPRFLRGSRPDSRHRRTTRVVGRERARSSSPIRSGRTQPKSVMRGLSSCVILVLLAACGSTKHAIIPEPSTTTIKPSSAAACAFVTQKDASKLFGAPATRRSTTDTSGAVSVCSWIGKNNAQLLVKIYNDEAHYGEQYVDNPQRVNGIGDRAYVRVQAGLGIVELQFTRN